MHGHTLREELVALGNVAVGATRHSHPKQLGVSKLAEREFGKCAFGPRPIDRRFLANGKMALQAIAFVPCPETGLFE
jgi:hypothetical protein